MDESKRNWHIAGSNPAHLTNLPKGTSSEDVKSSVHLQWGLPYPLEDRNERGSERPDNEPKCKSIRYHVEKSNTLRREMASVECRGSSRPCGLVNYKGNSYGTGNLHRSCDVKILMRTHTTLDLFYKSKDKSCKK